MAFLCFQTDTKSINNYDYAITCMIAQQEPLQGHMTPNGGKNRKQGTQQQGTQQQGCVVRSSKPLPYLWPKSVIFPTLSMPHPENLIPYVFMAWSHLISTLFQTCLTISYLVQTDVKGIAKAIFIYSFLFVIALVLFAFNVTVPHIHLK